VIRHRESFGVSTLRSMYGNASDRITSTRREIRRGLVEMAPCLCLWSGDRPGARLPEAALLRGATLRSMKEQVQAEQGCCTYATIRMMCRQVLCRRGSVCRVQKGYGRVWVSVGCVCWQLVAASIGQDRPCAVQVVGVHAFPPEAFPPIVVSTWRVGSV